MIFIGEILQLQYFDDKSEVRDLIVKRDRAIKL
jgi:hypothetical protein